MTPTPGPKIDETLAGDFDVITNGVRVARFFQHGPISPEQARANAEAWIAGMETIGKLERIREIIECPPMGENLRMMRGEIKAVLESKP